MVTILALPVGGLISVVVADLSMNPMKTVALFSVVACMPPAFAASQLPEVEVVSEAPVHADNIEQVDLESFTGFGRQIDRDQFQQQMATVSDVLDQTSGVQIRQVGGHGGFATVSMRGTGGKQVNLYLDGLLLNSAQTGGADLNLIPTAIIDRIEIYPDFTPVQLSNSNLGGAVNIVSVNLFEPRREASVTQGSFGAEQYSLAVADALADWNFFLGLNSEASDNDYDIVNTRGTVNNPDDDIEEAQNNAAYDQQSALLKTGTRWGQHQSVEALLNWSHADREIPAIDNNAVNDAALDSDDWRGQLKYNDRYGPVVASWRVFTGRRLDLYDDRNGTAGIGNEYVETREEHWGAAGIFAVDWWLNTTTLNLEYRDEDIAQVDRVTDLTALDNQRTQTLLGLQDDLFLLDDTLLFSVAVRSQAYRDKVRLDPQQLQVFDGDAIAGGSDTETGASFGTQYQLTDALKLKANLATQSRVPTLQERFGVLGVSVGNPELTPETSENRDIGAIWEKDGLMLRYVFYAKDLEDAIVVEVNGQGIAKAKNVAEAEVSGHEMEASWQVHERAALNLGATQLDSENHSAIKADNGQQLPGIYHSTFNAGADLNWRQWLLRMQYQYEDELYYDSANSVWPDAKETVNAQLRWSQERWSAQLGIDNLLDESYQDYHRFYGPGRAYYLNLAANW